MLLKYLKAFWLPDMSGDTEELAKELLGKKVPGT
jgi:hypothetical protein